MKILVIPDCHLKPWMFDEAIEIKESNNVDRMVFLGDLVDDWDKEFDIELYKETLETLIKLMERYPDTMICLGNHDYGYLHHLPHSGYSLYVNSLVVEKYKEIMSLGNVKIIHRVDNLIFSHAGLCERFLNKEYELFGNETIDEIIELIEKLPPSELWNNLSPLWVRPQYGNQIMYEEDKYIQVVGHTPTEDIYIKDNLISCDVFSTHRDGSPIGSQIFIIIDSITGSVDRVNENKIVKHISVVDKNYIDSNFVNSMI